MVVGGKVVVVLIAERSKGATGALDVVVSTAIFRDLSGIENGVVSLLFPSVAYFSPSIGAASSFSGLAA